MDVAANGGPVGTMKDLGSCESFGKIKDPEIKCEKLRSDVRENGGAVQQNGEIQKNLENLRSDVRENGGAVQQNDEIQKNLEDNLCEENFQPGESNDQRNTRSNGYNEREMKELVDFLSKLNPMAEEFVPHSLANDVSEPKKNGGSNGNVRRRNGYNQARRRTNSRISRAQREESIRKTVYVSDIDQLVTEEQLAALFSNCGQVVDCRVCGDPNSVLRFAFVEFIDEDSARRALSLSGTVLGYYPLRVLPSKTAILPVNPTFLPASEDERELCARTIYCTNIDKKVSQAEVKLFFESICGPVSRLRLLGDYQHLTRISFVEFVYAESAMAALNCSGAILGSLPIRVSPSKTPVRPRNPRAQIH